MSKRPVVIIGSGLAGYMLAKEFRKLDAETPLTIVTASEGDFYSKPLLSTALAKGQTAESLAVYSAEAMAKQLSAKVITKTKVSHIDVVQQEIHVIGDNHEERIIEYDRLILATGSRKHCLHLQGNAAAETVSVNNLEDYKAFRKWLAEKKHITIIGAGLVGCEFMNDLSLTGFSIEMVAMESQALAKCVPPRIGEILVETYTEKGIVWHLEEVASALQKKSGHYELELNSGKCLKTDGVMTAVGICPEVELAKTSGIQVNCGIVVDRHLQTNFPNIYALGDCAEVAGEIKQYVAPIMQCARTLAKILVHQAAELYYPPMPIVVKTTQCPVVCLPPPSKMMGEWKYQGCNLESQALFYDDQGKLQGFALIGNAVSERVKLIKQMTEHYATNSG